MKKIRNDYWHFRCTAADVYFYSSESTTSDHRENNTRALGECSRPPPRRIISWSEWLSKLSADFLVHRNIYAKSFMKIRSFFRNTSQIVEKCAISQCWKILQRFPLWESRCGRPPKFYLFFLVEIENLWYNFDEDPVSSLYVNLHEREKHKHRGKHNTRGKVKDLYSALSWTHL